MTTDVDWGRYTLPAIRSLLSDVDVCTGADRVLFSTDYPFHQPGRSEIGQFFDAIPDPETRTRIAAGNAEALFRLG